MLDSPIKIVKTESVCVWRGVAEGFENPIQNNCMLEEVKIVKTPNILKNIYQRPKKLTTSWSGNLWHNKDHVVIFCVLFT